MGAPATTPAVGAPGAPANGDPESKKAWSLGGFLKGTDKVRVKVPTGYNLYSKHAGKNFAWSTSSKTPGASTPNVPLGFGTIPLPPPVGPVLLELSGGVSAYAGGNALIDIDLKDIVLDATAADLSRIGTAAALMLTGMPVLSLGALATLKLKGEASLSALAVASLEAGADANLTGLVNSAAWPLAGYGKATLGAFGKISARGVFNADKVPIELAFGRLKLAGPGSWQAKAQLSAELGLRAAIEAGLQYGYRFPGLDASGRWELFRHEVNVGMRPLGLEAVVTGGEQDRMMTLNAGGDGPPEIDLAAIYVQAKRVIETLLEARDRSSQQFRAAPMNGNPGMSAEGIGRIGKHGSKPPSLRTGPPILHLESEHVIPFAVGKRLWEVMDLVVPGRGGHEDRGQTTIMIYKGAADAKTNPGDLATIGAFEAAVNRGDVRSRLDRARLLYDAGDRRTAFTLGREVMALMVSGLRVAKADAVARTNAAIITENQSHTEGSPLTNGQRRAAPGSSEPARPEPGKVADAAEEQYGDILQLAREAMDAANTLR